MAEFATMQTVASIRNTADTRNEFYEEEMAFFHREVPRLSLLLREADEALLAYLQEHHIPYLDGCALVGLRLYSK